MTFDDHSGDERLPNKEAILQALAAVGQQADGGPLDLDDIRRSPVEHLVGLLDAITSDLAERIAKGPGGRGESRRHLVVSGRRMYVESGRYAQSMDDFFTARVKSLGSDMQTWSSLRRM
jgi:hypothetical protein